VSEAGSRAWRAKLLQQCRLFVNYQLFKGVTVHYSVRDIAACGIGYLAAVHVQRQSGNLRPRTPMPAIPSQCIRCVPPIVFGNLPNTSLITRSIAALEWLVSRLRLCRSHCKLKCALPVISFLRSSVSWVTKSRNFRLDSPHCPITCSFHVQLCAGSREDHGVNGVGFGYISCMFAA
jgi:hypothetical protein